MHRKILKGLLLFNTILFLSLLFIIQKTFTTETFKTLKNLNKTYLLFTFFAVFMVHTFDNLRLYILSRALGIKYSLLYGYVISLINTFGATVTPAHVGGEGTAVYMLLRKGVSVHKVATVVTLKTITGAIFFLLVFPVLLFQILKNPSELGKIFSLLVIFLVGFIGTYFLTKKFFKNGYNSNTINRFKSFLTKYIAYLRYFYKRKKFSFFSASFAGIMLYISFLFIAAILLVAFNKNVSFIEVLEKQIGLLYAIFISPTPGGSGVGELGGFLVFAEFLSKHELGIFVILWRLISQYLSAFIGGIIFLVCILLDLKRYS